ncbi:MAG: GntR family transcriptional regulator [Blastococcus sp.]
MTATTARESEYGSLAEAVYAAVHHRIVTGGYRPNQRLVETDIAAELGASRTPVREALVQLVKDGLAVRSRQGLTVREFTLSEVREIYEVRAALEGYAARLAAQRATPEALADLALQLDRHALNSRGETIDRARVVEANAAFHNAVLATAANGRLHALATGNRSYFFNNEAAAVTSDDALSLALEEHQLIYEAIRDGEADRAEALVRGHVMAGLKVIESFL